MKKIILTTAIITSFASLSTHAESLVCPFKDYFHINAPIGYGITSLITEGNIASESQDRRNFTLSCLDNKSRASGKAYVTVSLNANNVCTLHLTDGPFEMNPVVNFVTCSGKLKYTGIEHLWGTYSYTLKFSQ